MARSKVPALPLNACGAETQGFLGYLIQQCLQNEFKRRQLQRNVVSVITQVIVDKEDPAFINPTKPIGPFYTRDEAQALMKARPELIVREELGKGFRRLVPSPDPVEIVETPAINNLSEQGTIVIASGGGGIPVIKLKNGDLEGVDAVIDKDLSAERLATAAHAEELAIMTDVKGVYVNYGSKNQQILEHTNPKELREYLLKGHFATGSMRPKVEAAIRFVEHGGRRAVIGELDSMEKAISGTSGTQVTA
jgi:carbamate kinase